MKLPQKQHGYRKRGLQLHQLFQSVQNSKYSEPGSEYRRTRCKFRIHEEVGLALARESLLNQRDFAWLPFVGSYRTFLTNPEWEGRQLLDNICHYVSSGQATQRRR
jgi:hypothetical protein